MSMAHIFFRLLRQLCVRCWILPVRVLFKMFPLIQADGSHQTKLNGHLLSNHFDAYDANVGISPVPLSPAKFSVYYNQLSIAFPVLAKALMCEICGGYFGVIQFKIHFSLVGVSLTVLFTADWSNNCQSFHRKKPPSKMENGLLKILNFKPCVCQ